jgi:hypothetical protein
MLNTKSNPQYSLEEIKQLVRNGQRVITYQSTLDADYIGVNHESIYSVVLDMKESYFYKSMISEKNPLLWQDVYHYQRDDLDMILYVKLQINKKAVVISFKEK